jgi:hypothetical protein
MEWIKASKEKREGTAAVLRSAAITGPQGQPCQLQQRVSKHSRGMQNMATSRGLCKQAGFTGGWGGGAFVHSRSQDLSFHMPDLCCRFAPTWPREHSLTNEIKQLTTVKTFL